MSFFGELDLENAPDDPNSIPDGTYRAFLTDIGKKGTKNDPNKIGVTFKYKLSEGQYDGFEVTEWKSANATDDDRTKSWLKQRLLGLGVPADRLSSVDPSDLIGKEVYVTVKARNGYTNVNRVSLADDNAESVSASAKSAFDL